MKFTNEVAVSWTDNQETYDEYQSVRDRSERERVSRVDIREGDRIDVTVPEYVRNAADTSVTTLFNARVTDVTRFGEPGEDAAEDFRIECHDWSARIYCDRAHWKVSFSVPDYLDAGYIGDCGTSGLYQYPEQKAETDDSDDDSDDDSLIETTDDVRFTYDRDDSDDDSDDVNHVAHHTELFDDDGETVDNANEMDIVISTEFDCGSTIVRRRNRDDLPNPVKVDDGCPFCGETLGWEFYAGPEDSTERCDDAETDDERLMTDGGTTLATADDDDSDDDSPAETDDSPPVDVRAESAAAQMRQHEDIQQVDVEYKSSIQVRIFSEPDELIHSKVLNIGRRHGLVPRYVSARRNDRASVVLVDNDHYSIEQPK